MNIARWLFSLSLCAVASMSFAADVERLPAATTEQVPKQIRLSFQLMEISRTNLRDINFHPDQNIVLPDKAKDGFWQVVEDSAKVERVMAALKAGGMQKEIAEPSLLAISGQPATFQMGKRIMIPPVKDSKGQTVDHLDYGTTIDTLQEVQEDGSLKLTVSLSQVDLIPGKGLEKDGQLIPAVNRREMKSSATLQPGQTLVLCGMVQKRVEATRRGKFWSKVIEETVNEIETVLLVRPAYEP